jgi:tetratricopeptide (TPR) repeat protein
MIGAFRRFLARRSGVARDVSAQDWLGQGNAALAREDAREAERCYRAAMAADPRDPRAPLNLGFVILEREPEAAIEMLQQAKALRRPADDFLHEVHYLLGRAHGQLGQSDPALANLAEAVRLRPGFAPALEQGVTLLQALQRHAEALEWARHWAREDPNRSSLLALAQALHHERSDAEALEAIEAVLAGNPRDAVALEGRGNMLLSVRRPREALADFDELLAAGMRTADLLARRGCALYHCGHLPEALQALDEALVLDPRNRDALYNRAVVLGAMQRLPEAEAASSLGLALHPDHAELRWNRANVRLMVGDYAGGWPDHEARWQVQEWGSKPTRPDCGAPWWTGAEDLEGRTILAVGEQGFGDALQFVRYVPLLQARGARVILRVASALHPVMRDAFPGCELVVDGATIAKPDFQCMLMSLPLAFGTTVESIPAAVPYLASHPPLVEQWRQRLGAGPARRVGIVWSGNAAQANDHNRSMALATLLPIAGPGVQLVSLQKEVRASDLPALGAGPLLQFGEALTDFRQTAALIECMDVVVTVCTSVAHLAGGLGKPVWLMLCHNADWRWFRDRSDSPWYPTARLFRQQRPGDWGSVVAAVRAALQEP